MCLSNRHVRNLAVWGEHGLTSRVDAQHAQIQQLGQWNSLGTALHDDRWLRHDLVEVIRSLFNTKSRVQWPPLLPGR